MPNVTFINRIIHLEWNEPFESLGALERGLQKFAKQTFKNLKII
jgi:hypothetical protein